jgi:hypothetical protein
VDFVAIKPYLIGWTVAEPFFPVCVSMGSNGYIAFELIYFHILLVSIVNRKDGEPYSSLLPLSNRFTSCYILPQNAAGAGPCESRGRLVVNIAQEVFAWQK